MEVSKDVISNEFSTIQDEICSFLKDFTGQSFTEDLWDYTKGSGGGRTRVWEATSDNDFLEKGGVAFSSISGDNLPKAATDAHNLPGDSKFMATGVSIVIHPRNPHIPTIHMNIRYFETDNTWWFGGGIDLTPYYPIKNQIIDFHCLLKQVCEKHNQPFDKFKDACDKYFFLPHRNESRGIGGIFFDQLNTSNVPSKSKKELFDFVCDVGRTFNILYKISLQNHSMDYSDNQREFQLIRRSRYVEFNLLWDRGTKFGIQSNGRTESILMSMPATAIWKYNYSPPKGSEEDSIIQYYFTPRDWASISKD